VREAQSPAAANEAERDWIGAAVEDYRSIGHSPAFTASNSSGCFASFSGHFDPTTLESGRFKPLTTALLMAGSRISSAGASSL
jgi:hypothetical protein